MVAFCLVAWVGCLFVVYRFAWLLVLWVAC